MRRNAIVVFGAIAIMSMTVPMVAYAEVGSKEQTQASQSSRWVGSGERWQVSDNAGGFIKDSWYQDEVSGCWYMLGAEDGSIMYAGLITDQSTGKSYLLNTEHNGTYGAMLTTDGVYNLNGKQVYLQFDQAHQGSYGAILSGLSEARQAGIGEKALPSIPTATAQPTTPPPAVPPKQEEKSYEDMIKDKYGITDEQWNGSYSGGGMYGGLN